MPLAHTNARSFTMLHQGSHYLGLCLRVADSGQHLMVTCIINGPIRRL